LIFVLVIYDNDVVACLRYRVVVGLLMERGACFFFVRDLIFVTNNNINISQGGILTQNFGLLCCRWIVICGFSVE
jgi:hypothetical protein